jgi:hypothetical protein
MLSYFKALTPILYNQMRYEIGQKIGIEQEADVQQLLAANAIEPFPGGDNTGGDNTGGDNTGGDNTGGDNTGGGPATKKVARAARAGT